MMIPNDEIDNDVDATSQARGVGCDDWNFGVYLLQAVSQKTEIIDKSIRALFKFFCCSCQERNYHSPYIYVKSVTFELRL